MRKMMIGLMLTALALAGCKSTEKPEEPTAPKVTEQDESSIATGRILAEQYMAHYLQAIEKDDFKELKSVLPEKLSERDLRGHFTEQMKWIREKLGTLKKSEFVGVFRKGALCEYVWKLTFEKELEGKVTQVDLPYLVRTVRDGGGEVKILMVGFVVR